MVSISPPSTERSRAPWPRVGPGQLARRLRAILRSPFNTLVLLLATLTAVLVLWPVYAIVTEVLFGDGDGPAPWRVALAEPGLGKMLWNTFLMTVLAVSTSLIVGCTFAVINERTDADLGTAGRFLPLIPLFVPTVASTLGWIFLFSPRSGVANYNLRELLGLVGVEMTEGPFDIFTWYGLIFVLTLNLVPYVYIVVSAGLRNVDPRLEEASRVSGAGPLRTMFRIILPSIKPSLGAAAFLLVVTSIALFSVPFIIGSRANIEVLTVRIVKLLRFESPARPDVAVALSTIVLVVVVAAWLIYSRTLQRGRYGTIGGTGMRHTRMRLGFWKWPVRMLLIGYIFCAAVLPLTALLLVALQPFWQPRINWQELSFQRFASLLSGEGVLGDALLRSVMLGAIGATIGMAIAALLGVYVQNRNAVGAGFVDGATKLPAAIPNLVIAVGFIYAFSGAPFYLGGTLIIMVMAFVVLYLPHATVTAAAAARQVGRELVEASSLSGSAAGRTFTKINLPLMLIGLLAGWALLFVRMVGEVTASALLATPRNTVVGFELLATYERGSWGNVAVLAVALTLVTSTVVTTVFLASRGRVSTG